MERLKSSMYNHLPPGIQNIILSMYGRRIRRERFCREYDHWQSFLDASQYFSLAQMEEYQNDRLRELITRAYEDVPYYRRIFEDRRLKPADIQSKKDLEKLPILTKDAIRLNYRDLISRAHRAVRLKPGHTSGTTGSPMEVLWDRSVDILHNVAIWRHRSWAGFHFGDRYATLLGRVVVPINRRKPPFFRINRPWNQYLFSSFHLTDENLGGYFDEFEKRNIRFMEAYPSTAYILARYLEQRGLFYGMKAIVTSSETLLPLQREVIEDRFRCRVFDYYGMAERVMFSGECEKHEGHHLFMEYGITEVADESGNAVPEDHYGKLVLTGLHNYGMPLIRYEIGDVSGLRKDLCSCGRTLPLLEAVTTKAEDIVVTADGRLISSSVLTHPFKPMHRISKSQIIQKDYDHLVLRIAAKPGYSEADTKMLLSSIGERLGGSMKIDIEFVDDIPPGANGKYRWVISEVPLRFGANKVDNLLYE